MKTRILFMLLMVLACLGTTQAKKKALFVIVDGIPADVIERVSTPAIDKIAAVGGYTRAYMGGQIGGVTETPTISAVCYNSLLTATWANKHNVWNNDITAPNYHYWNIFRIAETQKQAVSTAIFSAWQDNRTKLVGDGLPAAGGFCIDYSLDGLELDKVHYPDSVSDLHIFKIDEAISEAAAKCITVEAPDVTWVYLWYMDAAGHGFGDSEHFDRYTTLADQQVKRLWEAVSERQQKHNEEWMVVITTDHGRKATDGRGHGGQSDRERTTWIATNQCTNEYFKNEQIGIVDIVPSICRFMDFRIPTSVSQEWEGVPFIGTLDFSKLTANKQSTGVELSWQNYTHAMLEIYATTTDYYREGGNDKWQRVGKVRADQRHFFVDGTNWAKISVRSKNNTLPVSLK